MKNSRASYLDGRHFTEFLDELRNLKASANHAEAEIHLLCLINATESDPPLKQLLTPAPPSLSVQTRANNCT